MRGSDNQSKVDLGTLSINPFTSAMDEGRRTGVQANLEAAVKFSVDSQQSARVVELAAVVGCRKHGYQLPFRKEFIPIFDDLRQEKTRCHNEGWRGRVCVSIGMGVSWGVSIGLCVWSGVEGSTYEGVYVSAKARVEPPAETAAAQTWCARQIRSKLYRRKNECTTSAPKQKETPRSFCRQPDVSGSGSDQSRSHSSPLSCTSTGRSMSPICSTVFSSAPWAGGVSGMMHSPRAGDAKTQDAQPG